MPNLLGMLTSVRKPVVLLLCVFTMAAPPSASAQDDRVFVDPESPTGKEYALPIQRAREQGAADVQTQNPVAGARTAPLFGEGVESSGAGKSKRQRAPEMRGSSDDTSGATASKARSEPTTASATVDLRSEVATPDGAGGLAAVVGAGTAVLLVGGLVGLLLRRRGARRSPSG